MPPSYTHIDKSMRSIEILYVVKTAFWQKETKPKYKINSSHNIVFDVGSFLKFTNFLIIFDKIIKTFALRATEVLSGSGGSRPFTVAFDGGGLFLAIDIYRLMMMIIMSSRVCDSFTLRFGDPLYIVFNRRVHRPCW